MSALAFEDDGYSFRVRRVMQLDRIAEAAAFRNRPVMRFARKMLWPVWIALGVFIVMLLTTLGSIAWALVTQ